MEKEAPHVGTSTNPVQRLVGRKTNPSCASRSRGVIDRRPLIRQRQKVGQLFHELFEPDPAPDCNTKRRLALSEIIRTIHQQYGDDPPPPAIIEDVAKQVLGSVYKGRYSKLSQRCSLIHRKQQQDAHSNTSVINDEGFVDDQSMNCDEESSGGATAMANCSFDCEFETFGAFQCHLKSCKSAYKAIEATERIVSMFGVDIRIQSNFFSPDLYTAFKKSLVEEVMFVQERRKENRRAMSTTKRLYAVYGFEDTGIMYSNFSRASVDYIPPALSILLHRLNGHGHVLDSSCCIMISCYPPTTCDDMAVARANDRDTFLAMKAHKDDDVYLGERAQIEVLTLSGFIDTQNYSACPTPIGWQFFVCNQRGLSEYINLHDNMLLTQPKGMQCFLKHGVLGVASPFIRWVVTIRRINKAAYIASCEGKEQQTDRGKSIAEWIKSEQWQRALRPATHKQLRKSNKDRISVVSQLFPKNEVLALGKALLLDKSLYYCCSCDTFSKTQLHGCLASNSVVFGPRPLQIGVSYSMQQLIAVEFTGRGSVDASFEGDAAIGCTSMVLTSGFAGNDYSNWRHGQITVAGAAETIESVAQMKWNFRNRMVLASLLRKLPIEVVVEEDNKFVYAGTWYVQSQWIDESHVKQNKVTVMFSLVERSKYMTTVQLDCKQGFNKILRDFFDYVVASDSWLVSEGATVLNEVGKSNVHRVLPLADTTEQEKIKSLAAKAQSLLLVFGLPHRIIDNNIIIDALNSFNLVFVFKHSDRVTDPSQIRRILTTVFYFVSNLCTIWKSIWSQAALMEDTLQQLMADLPTNLVNCSADTGLSARELYMCFKAYGKAKIPEFTSFERSIHELVVRSVCFQTPSFKSGIQNPTSTTCYLNVILVLLWKLKGWHCKLQHQSFWQSSILQLFTALDAQPARGVSAAAVIKQLNDMNCWKDGQQDAHEMLSILRQHTPPLCEFGFTEISQLYLHGAEISSPTTTEMNELCLALSENKSVKDLLALYFATEDVPDFIVEPGVRTTVQLRRRLQQHPDLLPIVLKRFSNNRTKLINKVPVDLEVVIDDIGYYLYAIIIHSGTKIGSGHYKLLVNEEMKMRWFLYNDAQVTQVDHRDFLPSISGGAECAYILYYVKAGQASTLFATQCSTRTRRRKFDLSSHSSSDDALERPAKKSRVDISLSSYTVDSSSCCSDDVDAMSSVEEESSAASIVHEQREFQATESTMPNDEVPHLSPGIKINLPNFVRSYKYQIRQNTTHWLIDWKETKQSLDIKTNWVLDSQVSNTVHKLLAKSKQAPNFAEQQGWSSIFEHNVVPKKFNSSKCGLQGVPNSLSVLSSFELFFPRELQQLLVTEINRYAKIPAIQKQQERKLWRATKLDKLKTWAKEKETQYPELKSIKSWRDNCEGLDEYIDTDYQPSAKRIASAEKARKKWKDISLDEFRTFLGVTLIIRCVHGRRVHDYFKHKDSKYGNEWISSKISRKRFYRIWYSLHYDIDLLVDKVQQNFKKYWVPHQHVTFDETILPFLGRFYALQHIPTKPHPNGILLYLLTDSKYFIWDIDFYLGLGLPPKFQLFDVASKLLAIQKNYIITTDSKWGSEEAARLLDENGAYFLLSCKKNSPAYLFDEMQKKASTIGSAYSLYSKGVNEPIAATVFHDRNAFMNLMSNYVSDGHSWASLCPKVQVPAAAMTKTKNFQTKFKPLPVQEYSYSKGYVDEAARQLHTYDWPHKTNRWTTVIFNNVMMICVWNAYIIYKSSRRKADKYTKDFRCFLENIGDSLAKTSCRSPQKPSKLSRDRDADNNIVKKVKTRLNVSASTLHYLVPVKSLTLKPRHCRCSKCKQHTSLLCLGCSLAPGQIVPLCARCGQQHQKKLKVVSLFK